MKYRINMYTCNGEVRVFDECNMRKSEAIFKAKWPIQFSHYVKTEVIRLKDNHVVKTFIVDEE